MQKYSGVRSLVFDLWSSLFWGQYCPLTKHDRVKSIHVMNSTMYGLQRLLKTFPCQRLSFLTSWHGKRIEKTTCRSFFTIQVSMGGLRRFWILVGLVITEYHAKEFQVFMARVAKGMSCQSERFVWQRKLLIKVVKSTP